MKKATAALIGLTLFLVAAPAFADIMDCVGVTYTKEGTIQDVQEGIAGIVAGDRVKFTNDVVVTGLRYNGFWVQEIEATSSPFSGIFVYTGTGGQTPWSVGDKVQVIGEYVEYYGLSEIRIYNNLGCAKIVGSATVPQPYPLTVCDLNDSTNTEAEKWEGVLVSIDSVRVIRTSDGHGRWMVEEIDSDANCAANDSLWIGSTNYDPIAVPDSLDTLCSITGIGDMDYYLYRLQPRGNNDVLYCGLPPAPGTRYAYPIDDTHLGVEFDRTLQESSAENAWNYYITTFDITILTAVMKPDSFGVILTTSSMAGFRNALTYKDLTVQNVANSFGVPMTTPNTERFIPGVQNINYVRALSDSSKLAEGPICISAIVTAAPTEAYLNRHMFIQDRDQTFNYGFDCYVSGVIGIENYGIARGDSVLISGLVSPRYGNWQMDPVDTLIVASKGHPVPAPALVTLATALTEPYEGKLVRIQGLKVYHDSIGFGMFSLWNGTDTVGVGTIFSPGIWPYLPTADGLYDPALGDSITYVQGPMAYAYSNRVIHPRERDDICSSGLTAVDGGVPGYVNALDANRPNPFNPTTTIHFSLEKSSAVDLKVFDTAGREVRTLHAGALAAGPHAVTWDGTNGAGKDVSSGVYFYRLKAGAFENTKKMVLIR